MKNHSLTILYVLSLIAGVLLCIYWREANIFNWIVIGLGILLLIPCLISLIGAFVPTKSATTEGEERIKTHRQLGLSMILSGTAGAILGVLMIFIPSFFVKYIVYTFGAILILISCVQLSSITPAMRKERISGWFLTVPILSLTAGAIIICVGPEKLQQAAAILTGIILIIYSANGFAAIMNRFAIDKRLGSSSRTQPEKEF